MKNVTEQINLKKLELCHHQQFNTVLPRNRNQAVRAQVRRPGALSHAANKKKERQINGLSLLNTD